MNRAVRSAVSPDAVAFCLSVAIFSACSPMSVQLKEQIQAGSWAAAAAEGDEWLRDHRAESVAGDPEAVAVQRLVVEATLLQARSVDRVESYRAFRQRFSGLPGMEDLVARALEFEAHAYYRDIACPADSVEAQQRFRQLYPAGGDVSASRGHEAAMVLGQAWQTRTAAALRSFRTQYGTWSEVAAQLPEARQLEQSLAFQEARLAGSRQEWTQFLAEYASMPEAQAAGSVAAARLALTELDLAEAAGTGRLEAFETFVSMHPEPEWRVRADIAIADLLLMQLLGARTPDGGFAAGTVEEFLELHGSRPYLDDAAQPHEAALWAAAVRMGRSSGYRLFAALRPTAARAEQARTLARDLAWSEAEAAGTAEAYRDYALRYAADGRALEAERRGFLLRRLEDAEHRWPRAEAATVRHLPSGEVEVVLDVRDCDGQRVSGLQRTSFELFAGSEPQTVTEFRGLEADRPIDLVFAVDLSGSMEVEREAVREAIRLFSETLRFRGRQVRLGLVTFTDQLSQSSAPTARLDTFRDWLARLPENSGGLNEDTSLALIRSADLLDSSTAGAERAVVLLTDEHLQINRGGRAALGLTGHAGCDRLMGIAQCIAGCRARDLRCLGGCYGRLGAKVQQALGQCARRAGLPLCLSMIDWSSLQGALESCVERVDGEGPTLERLAARLGRSGLRLFLLIPETDGPTGEPLVGYAELSASLQGRIATVPQDVSEPGPYIDALVDIADQLSKQYVLRFRPDPQHRTAPVRVAVRHDHAWESLATLPGGDLRGLHTLGGTAACPVLLAVAQGGALYRSAGCGQTWAVVPGPALPAPPSDLAAMPAGGVAIIADQRLFVLAGEAGLEEVKVAELQGVDRVAFDDSGHAWLLGQRPDGARLLLVDTAPGGGLASGRARLNLELAPSLPEGAPAPLLLPEGVAHGVPKGCVLAVQGAIAGGSALRYCFDARGRALSAAGVEGLPVEALAAAPVLLPLPGHRGAFLLAAVDGAIHRTIDSGGHWTTVLEAGPPGLGPAGESQDPVAGLAGLRNLVSLPGTHSVVCAASTSEVRCSEDEGRIWFPVGAAFERPTPGHLTVVEGTVFLAQGSTLQRLERVLGRDIPASNLYFPTDVDRFEPTMRPFLAQLAAQLRRDSSVRLRVEGHADFRGGDAHNDDLARRRAENVARAVVELGGAPDRVQVASFGSRRPLRPGNTPADLARNRRVELLLLRPLPVRGWVERDCPERPPADDSRPAEDDHGWQDLVGTESGADAEAEDEVTGGGEGQDRPAD